jgi:putative phosphoesterase
MKIGVLSDTHDRTDTTAEAIRLLVERGAELLLHCGDIVSPTTVRLFDSIPTHFVFGNWDDEHELIPVIREVDGMPHRDFGHLTLAGKQIAWVHSHRHGQLQRLEQSNDYDYVFYGHSHITETHRTGKTLVANPGALQRARVKTCLLVDLASGELQTIEVPALDGKSRV